MKANINQIRLLGSKLRLLRRKVAAAQVFCDDGLDSGFSTIAGVSEAGGIHGRFLRDDPGSAKAILGMLNDRLGWLQSMLNSTSTLVELQDSVNAASLDRNSGSIDDAAGSVKFASEPGSTIPPVLFIPPIVALSPDFNTSVSEVLSIKNQMVPQTTAAWTQLSHKASEIAAGLEDIAASLAADNQGEVFDAAIRRFEQTAATAQQFSANAGNMATHTSAMEGLLAPVVVNTITQAAVVKAIPEPAERKVAEQAALVMTQTQLQAVVDASLPVHGNLLGDLGASARPGENIEARISKHAGFNNGLDTSEIAWPQALTDAAQRNELGPGSFEVVDKSLRPIDSVGMPPNQQPQLDTAVAQVKEQLQQATNQFGPLELDSTGTNLASHPAAGTSPASSFFAPGGPNSNLTSPYGPGNTTTGVGAGTGALPGMGNSALTSGRTTSGYPGTPGGGGAGSIGQSGGTSGPGGAGGIGGGGAGGAAGTGIGSGGGTGGASGASPASTGAGMGPGAAGGGRGSQGKNKQGQISSITTKIEAEPNLKALLGDLPPAIPGVIGAWVRQQ